MAPQHEKHTESSAYMAGHTLLEDPFDASSPSTHPEALVHHEQVCTRCRRVTPADCSLGEHHSIRYSCHLLCNVIMLTVWT